MKSSPTITFVDYATTIYFNTDEEGWNQYRTTIPLPENDDYITVELLMGDSWEEYSISQPILKELRKIVENKFGSLE